MMRGILTLVACTVAAHAYCEPLDYAGALAEVSTAPHYVRIVLEDSDGKAHQTCVFGGSLNLAIRLENGLLADRDGIKKATDIALANTERRFRFTNAQAIAVLPLTFSDADLAAAKAKLAQLSDAQLREGFRLMPWGVLHASFRRPPERDAAACALIEQGWSVGVTDIARSLYIDK